MRAHEFEPVSEKVNKEIFTPDWNDRQPILDGKYFIVSTIKYYGKIPNLYIEVYDSSKEPPYNQYPYYVAYARFRIVSRLWWKHLEAGMVSVNEKYRRQGIAAAIYQYVTKLGNTIKPSFVQLPDGKAMWKGFKQKGVLAIEQHVNEAKTTREDFEGMTIEMVKNGHVLVINALDDWGNNVLGSVAFNIGDDNDLDPQDLKVDERYQGQGIARIMYDYAKSKGYEIHRSYDQTDAGAGFWNKHRGEDVRVWESFDQPYPIKFEHSEYGDVDALTRLPDGTYLSIMFNQESGHDGNHPSHYSVEFYRNSSQEVTGEGDAYKVFATVIEAIRRFVIKMKPDSISFSASKEPEVDMARPGANVNPESRAKLYNRLVQRYAGSMGYSVQQQEGKGKINYTLRKSKAGMAEARTNPDKNLKRWAGKLDLTAFAEDIRDKENWGVSMTVEPKLGINPRVGISEDTPKGIYFYPLEYFIHMVSRYASLPWGDNMPYMQLFQYDRSGQMTRQTQVDPARLRQALSQYCPEEIIQQVIDEPDSLYDGTPYWTIYDALSRLGKSDETNIVRWNKVLRDLGFTSVFDPGAGWIATGEPTQGVILDPRIIKQHKMFVNRNPTILHRKYDINRLADAINWSDYYNSESQRQQVRYGHPDRQKTMLAVANSMLRPFLGKTKEEAKEMGLDQALKAAADKVIEILKQSAVQENFADGRNPQDKGDSKRHGINTKASVSSLRKTAKNSSGRKQQLAHWLANMKAGRAKKK